MKKQVLLVFLTGWLNFAAYAAPVISSFSPASGPAGTTVTIIGTGFDATAANDIVYFGATRATVSAATTTSLTVTVPAQSTYQYISVTNLTGAQTCYSSRAFDVTFTGYPAFLAHKDSSITYYPTVVQIADLDGDGKPDISVPSGGNVGFATLRNTSVAGALSLGSQQGFSTGSNPRSLVFADFDGDGKLDGVLQAPNSSGNIYVTRNTSTSGTISFASAITIGSLSGTTYCMKVADIDGDGRPDILATDGSSSNITVYLNTTSGSTISFAAGQNFAVGASPYSISVGDMDGDGKPDVAVANSGGTTISVLHNTSTSGSLSFATQATFTVGTTPKSVVLADIDGDGKLDLAVSNSGSSTVSILLNTSASGSINFATQTTFSTGASTSPLMIAAADMDGDGKTDLVTSNSNNTVAVLINTSVSGTASFYTNVNFATNSNPQGIDIADINGDGRPDIVTTEYNSPGAVSILLQTDAPQGSLSSSGTGCNGTTGQLTWTATAGTGPYTVIYNDGTANRTATSVVSGTAFNTAVVLSGTTTYTLVSVTDANSILRSHGFTGASAIISTIAPPVIASFSPLSGPAGSSVTITGTGFNTTPSQNVVYFGAGKATVTAATATSLTVTVPSGASYDYISLTTLTCGANAQSLQRFDVTFSDGAFCFGRPRIDSVSSAGGNIYNSATCDYDGDGKPDIAIGSFANKIYVFPNTSTPYHLSLGTHITITTTSVIYWIAVGDIDGDGKPDIIAGNGGTTWWVARNTSTPGSISFAAVVTNTTASGSYHPLLMDIDGDGKLDMVFGGRTNSLSVYRNTSTGAGSISFAAKQNFGFLPAGSLSYTPCSGDMDGDGKMDIVVGGAGTIYSLVLRNTSTPGTISFATPDTIQGMNANNVVVGDIDGDGKPDIIWDNGVYRNTSTPGHFSLASIVAFPTATGFSNPFGLGDVNGDGKVDILGASNGSYDSIYIFPNNSTPGTISLGSTRDVYFDGGTTQATPGVCDMDGDGKADVIGFLSSPWSFEIIQQIEQPQGRLSTATPTICAGTTGQLIFTRDTGVAPFTIIYNDGVANRTATNVRSGVAFNTATTLSANTTYTLVSIQDSMWATRISGFDVATATINVNPQPQGSLSVPPVTCSGTHAQLKWTSTAGIPPFTVVYNDGSGSRTATAVRSGVAFNSFNAVAANTTFTLTSVTDSNGCVRSSGFTTASGTTSITPPSISLQGNGTNITAGQVSPSTGNATDFGSVYIGLTQAETYTIRNTSAVALAISGIGVSGTSASMFVISGAPATIAANGSATFMVTFAPTVTGLQTATITVNNNSCTSPAYTFAIQGTGTTPPPGAALSFDGTSTYVALANPSNFNFSVGQPFSIEAKIQTVANTSQDCWIFSKFASVTQGYGMEEVHGQLSFAIIANYSAGRGIYVETTTPSNVNNGSWHQVAFTYDGSARAAGVKIYLDGAVQPWTAQADNLSLTDTITVSNPAWIGAANSINSPMNGSMDEVRVWDRMLCQAEIQNNMNCEIATTGRNLIANYHFNEGTAYNPNSSVTTLTDATGNGNTGTLTNFALNGPTSNWTYPGGVTSGVSCSAFLDPVINVQGNSNNITAGQTSPTTANNTDFGNVAITFSQAETYTIQNTGTAALTISSIGVSGANASLFIVSGVPASIAAGSSAAFTVTYSPTAVGLNNATITVNSNVCVPPAYTFAVKGTAINIQPQGSLTAYSSPVCSGSAPQLVWTATIGIGPYTVVYNDGSTNDTVNNVVSGTPFIASAISGNTTYTLVSVTGSNTGVRSSGFTGSSATVTATTRPTASLSGAAAVCLGAAESYTVTFTGATPWTFTIDTGGGQINSSNNSGTYTFTLKPAATKTIKVTALHDANCTSTAADLDSLQVQTTTACGITWTGATSTNWNTATNWNPAIVPNSCSVDVTIPTGTTNHPVISTSNIQIGNLTMGNSQSIALSGFNLSVCKNFTGPQSSGNPFKVLGSGTLILDGSAGQTMSGYGTIDGLTINNTAGVTLPNNAANHLSLYRGLTLEAGTLTVANSAAIILLSTSVDTVAWLNDFGANTGHYTGNLTVQRQIPVTGSAWLHVVSAPVSGSGTNFNSLGQSTYGWNAATWLTPSVNCSEDSISWTSRYSTGLTWHESHVGPYDTVHECVTMGWETVGGGDTWIPGQGYSVYLTSGSRIALTGAPNTGAVNVSGLTNSNWLLNTPEGNTYNSGWSFVGNPYPSSLELGTSRLPNGFDAQVQVYQPTGAYKGSYSPYLLGTVTLHLPAYQGFSVHKTAVGGTATWPFFQSERSTNEGPNYQFYKAPQANHLSIDVAGNGFADVTRIEFNPQATDGFDVEYDANKLPSNEGQPTLYTNIPGSQMWMGINSMGALTTSTTVPVGFKPGADGTFTFTVSPDDIASFDQSTYIYLEDKQNAGNWVNLRTNSSYTFASKASDAQGRFMLHFALPATSGITDVNASSQVNIFAVHDNVMVDFSKLTSVDATIQIYNILGQELSSETHHTTDTYVKAMDNLDAAYIVVRIRMADGEVIGKKLFITK